MTLVGQVQVLQLELTREMAASAQADLSLSHLEGITRKVEKRLSSGAN